MNTSETTAIIASSVTLFTAIIAAVLAFRSQLRLKAFELLLQRRTEVLKSIEERMRIYHEVSEQLQQADVDHPVVTTFCTTEFHFGLTLYHRAKGMAIGPNADLLLENYWSVHTEGLGETFDRESLRSAIVAKLNFLSLFYGLAHARMTTEIESISLSWFTRVKRRMGFREKLQAEKPVSGSKEHYVSQ